MAKYYTEEEFKRFEYHMKDHWNVLCLDSKGYLYAIKDWETEKVERPIKRFGIKTKHTKISYRIKEIQVKFYNTKEGYVDIIDEKTIFWFPFFLLQFEEDRKRFIKMREGLKRFDFQITRIEEKELSN
jgi:hypothetical protein